MDFLNTDFTQKRNEAQPESFRTIYMIGKRSYIPRWIIGLLLLGVVCLFLPWTQNIRADGKITALGIDQRPQEINSVIAGKVEKWYVSEGDIVQAGDTILKLGEVKVEYFDTLLLQRTREQLDAKQANINYYKSKASTSEVQMDALLKARKLKLEALNNKIIQAYRKLSSDSADVAAARNEYLIASEQLRRQQIMLDSGVTTRVALEQRKVALQNAQAKMVSAENKFSNQQQELTILSIELNSIEQEYAEKLSKVEGDFYQALSQIASGNGELSKLQNIYSNYDYRNKLYYILAPQSGQIVRASKAGLGEMVKEGEILVKIVPINTQYAVEIFVKPTDVPLLHKGQNIRFMFDGFPAIVFSGWPEASFGTFTGKINAIENDISPNGKFRVLVQEDEALKKWPDNLRNGTGAKAIALLNDVPVWYELWRKINGFPPDFYVPASDEKDTKK